MKILLVLSILLVAASGADLNHVNGNGHFRQVPSQVYGQPQVNNHHQDLNIQAQSFQTFQPQEQTSQTFVAETQSQGSSDLFSASGDTQDFQVNEQPQFISLNQQQPGDLQVIGVSSNGVSISGDGSSNFQTTTSQNLNIIPANLMLQMNDAHGENIDNNVVDVQEVSLSRTLAPNPQQENQNIGVPQLIQRTYNFPQLVGSNGQRQQQHEGQLRQENVAQILPFNLNGNAPASGNEEQTVVEQTPQVSGVFFTQTSQPLLHLQGSVIPDPSQPQISEKPQEESILIETIPETEETVVFSQQNEIEDTTPALTPLPRFEQELVSVTRDQKIEITRCEKGLLLDAKGDCVEPQVVRNVYLYAAPKQERKLRTLAAVPKPKIEYNIVFVRNPEKDDQLKPLVVPPPQQKTLVYVLNQKQDGEDQDLIEVPVHPKLEPEVYFVNYAENENPQLPGGIDLRTALQEMVLEGTVIEDTSDSLDAFVQSVGTLQEVEVEDTVNEGDDTFEGFFESVTEAENIDDITETPAPGYNYPENVGFGAAFSAN
ncbi:protein of unknown function DUF243 [Trinorchestia longiramus]|nr:protein of unknown function DUF243 [Trinorchestia longiramus]